MLFSLIRASKAQKALGLPKSSFYSQVSEGLLPPPIRLGKRSVGWLESEINAIIRARIQNRSDDEIKVLVQCLINERQSISE
ncbi:helix-turn-helix transcriptional regulator [Streptococcus sp.]|uniref:helix-turn-helix transcriptional regulator n=1 Tax=Streptococcus sp. TaxID=1306 RepID=UPI003A8CEE65